MVGGSDWLSAITIPIVVGLAASLFAVFTHSMLILELIWIGVSIFAFARLCTRTEVYTPARVAHIGVCAFMTTALICVPLIKENGDMTQLIWISLLFCVEFYAMTIVIAMDK